MKRILLIALALISGICSAQTFTVNNLAVNGTSSHIGAATFSVRPTFNGNTPWDSGNFNPSSYLTTASAASIYCPLVSCAMTGTPTAPTAALGTRTSQLATTAFVANHSPCLSILDFGGDSSGTNNNDTAFALTLASALVPDDACEYLPPGTYKFASAASYTFPASSASVSIYGAGPDISTMTWPSGGGLTIEFLGQFNSAHIRNLSFTTGTTATGSGLVFNQTAASIPNPANTALSDITNVAVHGADGYAANDYWTNGIAISGVSNINFVGDMVVGNNASTPAGIGIYVFGNSSLPPVVFNLVACTLNNLNIGFQYGNYVQGVTISQTNFTYVTNSIYVPPGETDLDQLAVIGSQFGQPNAGAGISINTWVPFTMISDNLFFINGTDAGIDMISGLSTVMGNTFHGSGASTTNGLVVASTNSSNPSTVTGNVFNSLGTGVFLQSGSTAVNVQSNGYAGNTSNVVNSGAGNTVGGGSP